MGSNLIAQLVKVLINVSRFSHISLQVQHMELSSLEPVSATTRVENNGDKVEGEEEDGDDEDEDDFSFEAIEEIELLLSVPPKAEEEIF